MHAMHVTPRQRPVINAPGSEEGICQALRAYGVGTNHLGTRVCVPSADIEPLLLNVNLLPTRIQVATGCPLSGPTIRIEAFMVQPNATRLARMAAAVRSGKLAIPIARKFTLSEAAAAQQLAEAGQVDGKVLLVPV